MPFVDLTLPETELARNGADEVALPFGVLDELVLEDAQLVLVLSLAALDVAVGCIVVLRFLEKRCNTLVQVVVFELVRRDVPELSKKSIVLSS